MLNRLQFLHKNRIFADKDDAISYLLDMPNFNSLYAEPLIMKYGDKDNPSLLLIIGSEGTGEDGQKKFFVIDNAEVLKQISDINTEIRDIQVSTKVSTKDSNTIVLTQTKGTDSNIIKADVKLARYAYAEDGDIDPAKKNIITSNKDGLFAFVNLECVDNQLIFTVNDKTTKVGIEQTDYVVAGAYDVATESLVLTRKSGEKVSCDLSGVINEWTVEGTASATPVVLTKERVIIDKKTNQYQDILRGQIRIAEDIEDNILKIDRSGKGLYAQATARNIMYDETTTIKQAIDNKSTKIANDDANILSNRIDGVYANVNLTYDSTTNTLTFTRSKKDGTFESKTLSLAGVELIDHMDYHGSTKTLSIFYKDNTGSVKETSVDMEDLLSSIDWIPQNDGHNVVINKVKSDNTSNQQVSADVRILDVDDNILTDFAHNLYVKGTADNIKYDTENTVKDELDNLKDAVNTNKTNIETLSGAVNTNKTDIAQNINDINGLKESVETNADAIQSETDRATAKEIALEKAISGNTVNIEKNSHDITEIKESVNQNETSIQSLITKIGGDYTAHDTVTDAINTVDTKVNTEINRAQTEEERLATLIAQLSTATTANSNDIANLQGDTNITVVNTGHNVKLNDDTTNGHALSADLVVSPATDNILTTTIDGAYANVDLSYEPTTNKLTFKTSNGTTKEFSLISNSLVKRIYYDPILESIVFIYSINGTEQTMTVSVRSLIDEWDAQNTDTVVLTKKLNASTQGSPAADVLTADVVISPASVHPDNILVKDNGLYVSGQQIATNKADIAEIRTELVAITTSVNNEAQARQEADTALAKKIEATESGITQLQAAIKDIDKTDEELLNKITTEITNRTNADEALKTEVKEYADGLVADFTNYTFGTTTTVRMTATDAGYVTSEVLTANGADNIIKTTATDENGTGIYAVAKLDYNPGTNVLTFTNTNNTKTIALNAGSIIDSMEVVEKEGVKYIVIKYKTTSGGSNQIEVNVADLLSEIKAVNASDEPLWLTVDNNYAGGGTGISGKIILSTAHNDNILVKDGNNGLYVSGGQIQQNKTDITNIKNQLDSYQEEIDNIENASGLNTDGTYNTALNTSTTYIRNSKSLAESNVILDRELHSLSGYMASHSGDVDNLNSPKVGENNTYIKYVEQKNGVLGATAQTFDNSVTEGSVNAPHSNAVYKFVTSHTQTSVSNEINKLDVPQIGTEGSYIQYVSETDGKVTATTKEFDSTVTSGSTNAPQSNAVYNYVNAYVDNMNVNPISGTNEYIASVSQANGKVAATTKAFDTNVDSGSSNAPQAKAVYNFVKNETNTALDALDFETGKVNTYVNFIKQTDGKVSATTQSFDDEISSGSTNAPQTKAVYNAIQDVVMGQLTGLDASITAGTGQYIKTITETDGLISGTVENFQSSVVSGNTEAPSSNAVYNFVTENITNNTKALSAATVGGNTGEYIYSVKEENGILIASANTFDNEITSGSTNAPQTKAVYNAIQNVVMGKLDGLDGVVNANDGEYVNYIEEVNGLISGTVKSFDTTVTSGSTNAPQSQAVYNYVTNYIDGMNVDVISAETEYIASVSQVNGKVAATTKAFDSEITSGSTNAPQSNAVYNYVTNYIDDINVNPISAETEYIASVSQINGKVAATTKAFDSEITSGSTNAPQTNVVYNYVSSYTQNSISDVIEGLDAPATGSDGSYIQYVSETDGIISAKTQAFDSEITSGSTNAPQSQAVYNYVTNYIDGMNVDVISAETEYIASVSQVNGKVAATTKAFDATLTNDSTNAPQTKVVYNTIIDVESAITKAIDTIKGSAGFTDNLEYVQNENSPIISGASNLTEAVNLLSENSYWKLNGTQLEPMSALTVGAQGFYETSDERVKHAISAINTDDVNKAKDIELKEFVFNVDATETKKYGVIAQEVEKIGLNNLVKTDANGQKSVDYISLLILKIQQLENEIKELKNK